MEDSGQFGIFLRDGNDGLQQLISPDFQKFPKIPRLNRDIIITEKIDGTNAQILITEEPITARIEVPLGKDTLVRVKTGRIWAASRNRWILSEADHYDFATWVEEHEEELLQLGPGRHFGEWWGQKILRNYGLDHKRFSLFNVSRWHKPATIFQGWEQLFPKCQVPPDCCNTVPVLYHGRFSTEAILYQLENLRKMGSFAAPGFMQPEGIVIYHTAGNCLFKVTLEHDDEWKGKKNE